MTRDQQTLARQAVAAATQVTIRAREALVSAEVLGKADSSPVTVADLAAQAVITLWLRREGDERPITGEEDASQLRADDDLRGRVVELVQSALPEVGEQAVIEALDAADHPGGADAPFWTIDPIDGTKGFLRPDGQYAVCLALIERGYPTVAAVGCPGVSIARREPGAPPHDAGREPTGILLTAVAGEGTREFVLAEAAEAGASHRACRVDPSTAASDAVLLESRVLPDSTKERLARVRSELGVTHVAHMDSQAKYALVARGDASAYIRLPIPRPNGEAIWDHASGVLLVEEAGGRASDLFGDRLDFGAGRYIGNNRGLLTSNGHFHDAIVGALVGDYRANPPTKPIDSRFQSSSE